MFCTGGIRCEKATSYALSSRAFPPDVPVYHLEGGILAYLDRVEPSRSKWRGECFVFDQRVAVTHGLEPSRKWGSACRGCRRPLSEEDKGGEDYVKGVSCRRCKRGLTERQVERFKERQLQCDLADKTGKAHIHDAKETLST